ncbi:hypothetical protein SDC9_98571 [bioreactor metagenome]|uniref:OmpA-like domain-containing protein n=1 Tax=bioreactor metagenome TaxID=1076179 RepID=A0A645AF83_9ZZZZ
MNSRRKAIVLICAALMPMFSWACRPSGMEHEVRFIKGTATLDAKAAESVAQWFLEARDRLKVFEVGLFGVAPAGDAAAVERAHDRTDTIERLIQSMNTGQAKIIKGVSERKGQGGDPDFDVIFIESQPGCLKINTCCPQPVKK